MSYRIAVGTSDGKNIDLKFGEIKHFLIYEVEGKEIKVLEKRAVEEDPEKDVTADTHLKEAVVYDEVAGNNSKESDGSGLNCGSSGCNTGACSGNGHGCGGPAGITEKVEVISDCRCVLCAKVGFQAQKQFERKAISVFDIACSIEEALEKITGYYDKIDNHKSLRTATMGNHTKTI